MISIIVPYKDAAPWIRRCCESLHHIADDGFEFLMVNDNYNSIQSEDRDIVVEYALKDKRFRLLFNQGEPGVSGARNAGIERATGEWITFLDADDEMLPGANRAFRIALKADANVHQINHKRYYPSKARTKIKYGNLGGWYDIEHLPAAWYGVWNKLFRAEFLRENNIRFREGLQYGEDGLFVLECLAVDNRIHHADLELYAVQHNLHPESLSHQKTPADVMQQIHEYEAFLLRQDDNRFRRAVCEEVGLLWSVRMKKFYME